MSRPIDLGIVEDTMAQWHGLLHVNDIKRVVQELKEARLKIARVKEYAENSDCRCGVLAPSHICDICVIRQVLGNEK